MHPFRGDRDMAPNHETIGNRGHTPAIGHGMARNGISRHHGHPEHPEGQGILRDRGIAAKPWFSTYGLTSCAT